MPATLYLGYVLAGLALLAILASVGFGVGWLRHRGHGRGTPQYARGRLARRNAVYSLAIGLVLAGLCLTPLCNVALAGDS